MAEVVANTGVSKESGYLYYLGKDGNVWRSQMARAGKGGGNAEKGSDAGVTRESGYLYFIDKIIQIHSILTFFIQIHIDCHVIIIVCNLRIICNICLV